MLAIYRRHTKRCPFSSVREWRCGCPIWVSGTISGATIPRSLNLVSRGAAQSIIDRWEKQGFVDDDPSLPCPSNEEAESSLRNLSELTKLMRPSKNLCSEGIVATTDSIFTRFPICSVTSSFGSSISLVTPKCTFRRSASIVSTPAHSSSKESRRSRECERLCG
jgi:hypothetical protein